MALICAQRCAARGIARTEGIETCGPWYPSIEYFLAARGIARTEGIETRRLASRTHDVCRPRAASPAPRALKQLG